MRSLPIALPRPVTAVALFAWTLVGWGCPIGDDGPAVADVVVVDVPDGVDAAELPEGAICYPGQARACIVEGGKEAQICNASGTAFVRGVCTGDQGLESQCVNSRCTRCFPGVQICDGEERVVRCAPDGDSWETAAVCEGGVSGQVCRDGFCQSLCERNVKFNSYIGCDYWGVDLDNAFVPGGRTGYYDAQGAQYAIAVANPPDSPVPAAVEITQMEGGVEQIVPFDSDGSSLPTEPLQPGELRVYRLPRRDVNGTILAPLAYRVKSSVPIIAYQFNPLENEAVFSNDASLLMPATLLGSEYIVMTREQTFDTLRGFLTVVAVLPGTTRVSVQVSASTMAGSIRPGSPEEAPIAHMEPGTTRMFELQQFDVLNIETDRPGEDLTGSRVLSDKRVAVFGGSEAANAPNTARCVDRDAATGMGVCEWDRTESCRTLMDCVRAGLNTCCADHLEQQLFPVKVWGSRYVASKSWDWGAEADIWRVIAAEDNTRVVLDPPQQGVGFPVLNAGEWFEFESRMDFEISSEGDKPILVGQFLAAQDAPGPNVGGGRDPSDANTGDPAFLLAIPVEQYRRAFVILTPAEYAFNYINVVAPMGSEVQVDGEEIPATWFQRVGDGDWGVYRQRIEVAGPHTITSSEPAGVIVYGYDQYVSYGYTGGLDLAELRKERSIPDSGDE